MTGWAFSSRSGGLGDFLCRFWSRFRNRLGLRLLKSEGHTLFPLRQRDDLIHLCKRVPGRLEALGGRAAYIGVAEHRVLRDAIAVEERGPVDQHGARVAFLGAHLQPLQAFCLIAVLEEEEPERGLSVHVILSRSLLEPGLRRPQIDQHTASQPVGLAHVERGVGIACFGKRAPDCDGARIIAPLPGIDTGLDVLRACGRRPHKRRTD